jgi:hypothetical protein
MDDGLRSEVEKALEEDPLHGIHADRVVECDDLIDWIENHYCLVETILKG